MSLIEQTTHAWTSDSVRLIETPSMTTRATMFHVQEIGSFKTFHPYHVRRANLSSYLIVITVGGNGILEYRGRRHILSKGDVFYIDCHEPHVYMTPESGHWDFLWIHFQGIGAQGYHEYFNDVSSPVVTPEDARVYVSLIEDMIRNIETKPPRYPLMNALSITRLLTALIFETDNHSRQIDVPPYVNRMVADINRNFSDPLTLTGYSRELGVSPHYLSKMFKKHTGVTFQECLIACRITEAKTLLRHSDESVQEIAKAVGVTNTSHFINLFKDREGTTPHKYRVQWRK